MNNRNPRGARTATMVALGAAVPVLAIGYFLVSPGTEHATPVADLQAAPSWPGSASGISADTATGDSEKGGDPMMPGYPMMAMPGSGPDATNPDSTDTNNTDPNGVGPDPYSTDPYSTDPYSTDPYSTDPDGSDPQGGASAGSTVTAVASQNWAGYAATGAANSFNQVSASWVQPAVTCGAADTFSSFWVGLDGDGTPTVEQTGTEADCANGAATYQGWYEIFPNAPVFYRNPVQPGDRMSASVVAGGNGVFTLTLADGTQGWTQTTQQVEAAAQLGSAEVIAEAPSAGAVLPLADFGTVNFAGATVNGAPLGGSANLNELTLESGAGAALATPSALTGGNAFSVTFDQAGR